MHANGSTSGRQEHEEPGDDQQFGGQRAVPNQQQRPGTGERQRSDDEACHAHSPSPQSSVPRRRGRDHHDASSPDPRGRVHGDRDAEDAIVAAPTNNAGTAANCRRLIGSDLLAHRSSICEPLALD